MLKWTYIYYISYMSVPLNWKGRHICHTMATISVYRFFQFVFFFFFLFVYFSDVFFTRLRRFVLFLKSCFFKIEYSNVEFYVCFSNRVEWQEFFLSCFQILLLQKFSNAVNKFSCNENVSFVFNCFLFPVKKRLLLLNMIDYTCI